MDDALTDFSNAIDQLDPNIPGPQVELNAFIEEQWLPFITDIKEIDKRF